MNAREKAAQAVAEGDTQKAARWTRIAEIVDQAPAFDEETKARLRILLRPVARSADPIAVRMRPAA